MNDKIYRSIYKDWRYKGDYAKIVIRAWRLRHIQESLNIYILCATSDCESCNLKYVCSKDFSFVKKLMKLLR